MKSSETDKQKTKLTFLFSILLLLICFFISLLLGAEKIDFINALFNSTSTTNFDRIILLKLRLPRSLLAIISGALLAGTGAAFQMFFRNELAEPGLIGISSGATLGAVFATCLGLGTSTIGMSKFLPLNLISPVNIFAFLGAILAGGILTAITLSNQRGQTSIILLLCGTALGTLYSSISSIILISSNKEIRSIYSWLLGSFNGRGWNEFFFILLPSIASITIIFSIENQLDLLSCGETSARSLGVSVNKLRVLILIASAFGVSASVCAGGTISFVGLIAPHIVRRLTNPKAKTLLPLSMIFGAILLLVADTLARVVIAPAELPAGVITSILGVPFFLSLFLRKK